MLLEDILPVTNCNEMLNSELFADKLFIDELNTLANAFPNARYFKSNIEIGQDYYQFLKSKSNRRGEIVFALENNKNQILLHTKSQFPNGVYRLLSGGIDSGEPLQPALEREVFEETGFKVTHYSFLGIIFYLLHYEHNVLPFVSYVFHIDQIIGEPEIHDKSENITGFRWIEKIHISEIYSSLLNVPKTWQDWGLVRAYPHLFLSNLH